MSINDVIYLRKEHKLLEAYDVARRDIIEDCNEWTRASLFWVLNDFVKVYFLPHRRYYHASLCLRAMSRVLPIMHDPKGYGTKAYEHLARSVCFYSAEVDRLYRLSATDATSAYLALTRRFGVQGERLLNIFHKEMGWVLYRYMCANISSLSEWTVRCLLRDYLCLAAPRPSELHSSVLAFAVDFSFRATDFRFTRFLALWGLSNLRPTDYEVQRVGEILKPSLAQRVCQALVYSGETFDVVKMVGSFSRDRYEIIDYLREACYHRLRDVNEGKVSADLWAELHRYAVAYAPLSCSPWHSRILELALSLMLRNEAWRLLSFMQSWDGTGNLREADYWPRVEKTGTSKPSVAEVAVRRCFSIVNRLSEKRRSAYTLEWLRGCYRDLIEHGIDHEAIRQEYDNLSRWLRAGTATRDV